MGRPGSLRGYLGQLVLVALQHAVHVLTVPRPETVVSALDPLFQDLYQVCKTLKSTKYEPSSIIIAMPSSPPNTVVTPTDYRESISPPVLICSGKMIKLLILTCDAVELRLLQNSLLLHVLIEDELAVPEPV